MMFPSIPDEVDIPFEFSIELDGYCIEISDQNVDTCPTTLTLLSQ